MLQVTKKLLNTINAATTNERLMVLLLLPSRGRNRWQKQLPIIRQLVVIHNTAWDIPCGIRQTAKECLEWTLQS